MDRQRHCRILGRRQTQPYDARRRIGVSPNFVPVMRWRSCSCVLLQLRGHFIYPTRRRSACAARELRFPICPFQFRASRDAPMRTAKPTTHCHDAERSRARRLASLAAGGPREHDGVAVVLDAAREVARPVAATAATAVALASTCFDAAPDLGATPSQPTACPGRLDHRPAYFVWAAAPSDPFSRQGQRYLGRFGCRYGLIRGLIYSVHKTRNRWVHPGGG